MPITNFDKVELLLPMTGANNGTVFTDYSLRQRLVTRTGAVTSTAHSAFAAYGSSGFFDGTDDRLDIAASTGIDLSGGDFCIEFWARPQTNFTSRCFADKATTGADRDFFIGSGAGGALLYTDGSGSARLDLGAPSINTWAHYAFYRISNVLYGAINGEIVDDYTGALTFSGPNSVMSIGARRAAAGPDRYYHGNIQDFCITKGAAVYPASNFTPPPRMTQRTLTRTNTGVDSHEYDRAVLFDFNGGAHVGRHTTVIPDSEGDFEATGLIDLEYGVAFLKDGCGPICRGPFEVDPDA